MLCFPNIGCDKPPFAERVWSISIKNNTAEELIFIHPSYNRKTKSIENINLFPDTSLLAEKPINMPIIPAFSENYIDFKVKYEKVFEAIPSGKLSIYLFSKDTLNKHTWEQIRQDYKVLKRYDLTYDELKQMNWTVSYP